MRKISMLLASSALVGLFLLAAYYVLIQQPAERTESLRFRAETACQGMLKSANIASDDKQDYINKCIDSKLIIWK
jgi:hypothetical protein